MFKKPNIGQVVTVTTEYSDSYYYSQEEWKYTTYENLPVLPSHKLDKPNTFRIPAINEPYITERIIALQNVSDLVINGEAGEQHSGSSKIRTVTVKGSKGNEYTVLIDGDEPKSCTCPHHVYRHSFCKHMKTVSVSS